MLKLIDIIKDYPVADTVVHALKGVSINFRKSEFVSILGQSGCGKTTLLNIVGGLDKYTSGDLIINGISTKNYKDGDWDAYRNHSIGFIFQSYNLISHQSVLGNVELALTLSGVSKQERKKRAIEALEKVGLSDQINKKPNQLSGGQMQRVAIARALVNNPDIILADEPTGALDSETSVQVMEILEKISKDKLIIMVTHNPTLAEKYSTRIIKLSDGLIIDDSNPYECETNSIQQKKEEKADNAIKTKRKFKIKGMSFLTALQLSFRNLLTKKGRTILTSFAGSIGIIGIALILSLSSGFNNYINTVQKDTLSNYPLTINTQMVDYTSMINTMTNKGDEDKKYTDKQEIYSNDSMDTMFSSMSQSVYKNDLASLKKYLENKMTDEKFASYVSAIQYTYNMKLSFYKDGKEVNNLDIMSVMGMGGNSFVSGGGDIFQEMIDNPSLLSAQYDMLKGKWPSANNSGEAVLVVNSYNQISDYALYNMGFGGKNIVYSLMKTMYMSMGMSAETAEAQLAAKGITYDENEKEKTYSFDDFLNAEYQILASTDYYNKEGTNYIDYSKYKTTELDLKSEVTSEQKQKLLDLETAKLSNAKTVKIVGIVRRKENVTTGSISGVVAYTKNLTNQMIDVVNESEVITAQKQSDKDILSGNEFTGTDDEKREQREIAITKLGGINKDIPASILIFNTSFENKDKVVEAINEYNLDKPENEKIKYTDTLGIMMSSITTIINAISYVLIAFVSISLVVSSIMIGIITYISVLERTKEIGILRSIGASKKDISRVFNAETLIVGFVAGIMGIGITLLLNIPINIIIDSLAGIGAVSKLPIIGGLILVLISMVLTLIAGLIPSGVASKKDPVVALRTE